MIQDKTIGVSPVGCSVLAYNYLDIRLSRGCKHGRAPAVATGIAMLNPDRYGCSPIKVMVTWHLSDAGKSCTLVTVVKTSWLSLLTMRSRYDRRTNGPDHPFLGQVTATTPYGRDAKLNGFPMKLTELLAITGWNLLRNPSVCSHPG